MVMADPVFAYHTSASCAGFLKSPALQAKPDAPFVVAGVAWDGATTNRPGARHGPGAIRRASYMLCDATHPLFDVSPVGLIADAGDLPLPNTSLESMRACLVGRASELLKHKQHMIWLGGDHSITLGILRAYRTEFDCPLALIHLDAHCDTWTDHYGEPSGHGTWLYEALQEGLVEPRLTFQFGIRSPAVASAKTLIIDRGGLTFTARDLRGIENPAQLAPITNVLRDRLRAAGSVPVYLSLDIDCLDPAFAPGTGTPEPGGLTSSQVLTMLEEWNDFNFVGMDLCEVSPPFDFSEMTSAAAATFIWTYLCGRIRTKETSPD